MLELMLQRGQGYAELSGLLGIPEEDVRSRARDALRELVGEDPDRNVGLTDYLLGQADPIDRADAARHLREDDEDRELASELAAKLRLLVPDARLPRLPGETRQPRPRRISMPASAERLRSRLPARLRREGPRGAAPSRTRLSGRQNRLIVALSAAGLLLVFVVLAVTGAFGGGSSSSSSTSAADSTSSNASATDKSVRVTLAPQHGGQASGSAVFATASAGQPYVELNLSGLQQPPQGRAYVAWLLLNEQVGHPLTPVALGTSGNYDQRIPLSNFQLPLAQRACAIDISIDDAAALTQELQKALHANSPILPYQGQSVLRGEIPGAHCASGPSGAGGGGGSGAGG